MRKITKAIIAIIVILSIAGVLYYYYPDLIQHPTGNGLEFNLAGNMVDNTITIPISVTDCLGSTVIEDVFASIIPGNEILIFQYQNGELVSWWNGDSENELTNILPDVECIVKVSSDCTLLIVC